MSVCDPKAAAYIPIKDIFDCTRCPSLNRVVARLARPGVLSLNILGPVLDDSLNAPLRN